jgi:hypothetical protein
MLPRPHTKYVQQKKSRRCPKCGRLLNNQLKRCKSCGQPQTFPKKRLKKKTKFRMLKK